MLELRPFTEDEYHIFFRSYIPDPMMTTEPFIYKKEQISRSFAFQYGGYQKNYAHFGIFINQRPVGAFQLKRIDTEKGICEFGIILQNDTVKNKGIGSQAIRMGLLIARDFYNVKTIFGDTSGRNQRMIRVFGKLGFQHIETIENAYPLPDGRKDTRLVFSKNLMEDKET